MGEREIGMMLEPWEMQWAVWAVGTDSDRGRETYLVREPPPNQEAKYSTSWA